MGSLREMGLPRYPLLREKEIFRLLKKARQGDHKSREKLIECNFRLVFNVVKRFESWGYDEEDLFQIGVIGLIKAIDNFDSSFGVKFSTYAVPMILGEIRRFLRDDHPVKVTRALKEMGIRVKKAREQLMRNLGREPTVGEIAEALGVRKEEVVVALEAMQLPTSVYEAVYQDGGSPICVLDHLKSEDGIEPGWFEKIALKEALGALPNRERQIILLRFFQDKTQTEVGSQLGLSQVQVSRLERQAVARLRELLRPS